MQFPQQAMIYFNGIGDKISKENERQLIHLINVPKMQAFQVIFSFMTYGSEYPSSMPREKLNNFDKCCKFQDGVVSGNMGFGLHGVVIMYYVQSTTKQITSKADLLVKFLMTKKLFDRGTFQHMNTEVIEKESEWIPNRFNFEDSYIGMYGHGKRIKKKEKETKHSLNEPFFNNQDD